ncbi:hypothetical protein M434DRAFT_326663 [Hypoxylon sp. CO27-5]|nr:hypothetical protein M434DRAFT_326663 [Hypoxylon sp. CO27-5]
MDANEPTISTEDEDDSFQQALSRFKNALSPRDREDFKTFCSGKCLIEFMMWQVEDCRFEGPIEQICDAISKLDDSLQPYFTIINSFVSSNPEIAGIIWGSIQLVFKLCKHYKEFMQKLAFLFYEIAAYLDVLDGRNAIIVADKARARVEEHGVEPRLVKAMSYLYTDVLEICHYIYKTFVPTKRSSKSTYQLPQSLTFKIQLEA